MGGEPRVTRRRPAGPEHEVVSVDGGPQFYRRSPCDECPWRTDQEGKFPPEAFLHSAETAYDMSDHLFACHMSTVDAPLTCAGFLLRGAFHNLAFRMNVVRGRIDPERVHDGGHMLHPDYRAMAVANGCSPDDPRLAPCRGAGYDE